MKRKITNIILVLGLIIGICLLLYPSVADYVNTYQLRKSIQAYEEVTQNMTEDQYAEQFEAAHAFNEKLSGIDEVLYHPDLIDGYEQVLDTTGTGIMGYISIERIGENLPIYHSVEENVLQIAVGHLPGTSLPVGGEGTHCVLSGHRGLPSAKLFTNLDKMELGDVFYITVLNQVFAYQVDQIKVVLPTQSDDLQLIPGEDHVTLLTCTPYGVNSHRLLVRGIRVEYVASKGPIYVANEAYQYDPIVVMPVVAAPLLLLLFLWWIGISHRRMRLREIYRKGMKRDEAQ